MNEAIKYLSPVQAVRRIHRRRPKILCATDLSRRCDNAVARAAMLMRTLDAEVLLLHVIDPSFSKRTIHRKKKLAYNVLDWKARKLARMTGGLETAVRVGDAHQIIARVATEWDADLVVLGTYSKRAGDSFLDTSAERVMRDARRPILIANGVLAGPYARVLLATNVPNMFAQVARMTRELGLLEGASASIVQILGSANHMMHYVAGFTKSQIAQHVRLIERSSADALSSQLTQVGLNPAQFSVVQKHASAIQAIEDVAVPVEPELIVIGDSRFPVIKNVFLDCPSKHVLRTMPCDVLVVSAAAIQRVDEQTAVHDSEAFRNVKTEGMKISNRPDRFVDLRTPQTRRSNWA